PGYCPGVRRALGVFAVVAAFAAAAGAATPVNGRIGYLRPLGGNAPPDAHLFAMNPDGSGAVDLSPAGYTDVRSFAWSPDGRRIAFSAVPNGEVTGAEIFSMNADGSEGHRVTNNQLPDFGPSWSHAE